MTRATAKLWALHLVANAVVLAGVYFWLGIGDASGLQLTATAFLGLLVAAFGLWLHGAAFAHFREPGDSLAPAYRAALRHIPALAVAAVVAGVLYWGASWLMGHAPSWANMTASWLTLKLHRPIRPALILRVMTALIRVLQWFVIPLVLLPAAAAVSDLGWRGFVPRSFARAWRLAFVIACPVLLVLALYVPWRLVHWVPYEGKLAVEVLSFLARWLVAWLLFVTGWLGLAALSSGYRNSPTQTAP